MPQCWWQRYNMKLSSTALQSFFNNIINTPGQATNIYMVDLYTFVTGSGRVLLNQTYTPSSNLVTVSPPQNGIFVKDLGVRETNGDILTPVLTSPVNHQYTVNNGIYTFYSGDSSAKLISFIYKIGNVYNLPTPSILQICSADIDVTVFGQTFTAGGRLASGIPAIQRSKMSCKLGLEVSSEEIDIYADPSMQIGTNPILSFITQGLMDGATIYIQRGYSATPDFAGVASMGPVIAFSGTVAETKIGRSSTHLTIKSRTELLDLQMPRLLYNPGCQFTLFDSGCTLNPANYTFTGTVQAGSNVAVINTNLSQAGDIPDPTASPNMSETDGGQNLPAAGYWAVYTYVSTNGESLPSPPGAIGVGDNQIAIVYSPNSVPGAIGWNCYMGVGPGNYELQTDSPLSFGQDFQMSDNGLQIGAPPPTTSSSGYFDQGVITFISGSNVGLSRVVSEYTNSGGSNGVVAVVPPFPYTVNTGDTFSIIAGCSKNMTTCKQKFNNLINFGGYPFVPTPETGI